MAPQFYFVTARGATVLSTHTSDENRSGGLVIHILDRIRCLTENHSLNTKSVDYSDAGADLLVDERLVQGQLRRPAGFYSPPGATVGGGSPADGHARDTVFIRYAGSADKDGLAFRRLAFDQNLTLDGVVHVLHLSLIHI